MSVFALSNPSGALGNVCSFLVKVMVVLSCAISVSNADITRNLLQWPAQSPTRVPESAPAVSDRPLPLNRPRQKHFSPRSAPTLVAPAQPPLYGPLITSSHPPTSSRLSKPLMKRSASVPPGADLPNIAPTQISPGTIPAGLAQPPLSPEVSSPVVVSEPVEAPAHQSSYSTSLSPSNKGKHSNLILIFGISAGILVFAIISVLIICSCTFREGKPKASLKESVKPRTIDAVARAGSLPHPSSTRFLQYEELKEATNNFAPASILGEGGFGRVFKGVLSDGTAVAIKRLTSGGAQGDKEFLVEVEMLSRLHHRNLVKLVGYYSSRDSSQNLLCYELVPNGSLEAWLHGPLGVNCPLDWDTRMKIALDAARGLAYLHEDSQPCVIHRDFKASNILLENNFHAKARPILRDKDRLEELADPRLGGKYPKEDYVRVCTIAAACVAPEASQRPTMGEVVQSLKMVQRVTEYQDSMLSISNNRPNQRQSSTTFESDETSSMFSSGPYSGLSAFDNDNISRTAVSSEDLHEGR
ncbi:Protein kinase domain - like 10 [Theobroma cacao]|nr:Protein kinase domain - like 10 [Theobroma cacao]